MLDKLLKYYKNSNFFEVGDGFICGYDGFTLATVFDNRFQEFVDGIIDKADLKRLIEAEDFGCEQDVIWVENGGKRDLIEPYQGVFLTPKVGAKGFGKPLFESEGLFKAIKEVKVSDTPYLGFEGSKALFFDADWNSIFEIEVPNHSEQEVLYNLERVNKFIKMKNESPIFSIVEFGEYSHPLRLYWDDFEVYIANGWMIYEKI